jgi:hypothetical protein
LRRGRHITLRAGIIDRRWRRGIIRALPAVISMLMMVGSPIAIVIIMG